MNYDEDKLKYARGLAAQAWCQKKTENKVMDSDLAEEFAKILANFIKTVPPDWNI